ncbi:hypothetical protein MCUN1_002840 [Malassezia cuniculi]|uniref:SigF-like NTF2-like domain-containing protein n=1 Tax=Malassezia cuniculi TaxID=948313 RepID=A0AAF0J7R3_9BASI|nr:hypothetical protein MCUN1_002840 [Malassezia cuniculi]
MEDPKRDITDVVKGLVSAKNANEQRDTLQHYFLPDASFDHPLCAVSSYSNSRDTGILPIYQWLRIFFKDTLVVVDQIAFDEDSGQLYFRATQTLRAPILNDKKYYVQSQQDYYSFQELPGKFFPMTSVLIEVTKLFIGFFIAVLATIIQLLGVWRVKRD